MVGADCVRNIGSEVVRSSLDCSISAWSSLMEEKIPPLHSFDDDDMMIIFNMMLYERSKWPPPPRVLSNMLHFMTTSFSSGYPQIKAEPI